GGVDGVVSVFVDGFHLLQLLDDGTKLLELLPFEILRQKRISAMRRLAVAGRPGGGGFVSVGFRSGWRAQAFGHLRELPVSRGVEPQPLRQLVEPGKSRERAVAAQAEASCDVSPVLVGSS